ncbi:hypothetical protein [Paenibacillus sp. MMS18-CY102]|uniref:hypothetical protein n=1 Tax=Paenibacillus sp. MMS18-CY102 TaxID=2682849 RepID=UPI001920B72E|nr:hypothetical protein [Paenibacillus sp. MMS18-CY102]
MLHTIDTVLFDLDQTLVDKDQSLINVATYQYEQFSLERFISDKRAFIAQFSQFNHMIMPYSTWLWIN